MSGLRGWKGIFFQFPSNSHINFHFSATVGLCLGKVLATGYDSPLAILSDFGPGYLKGRLDDGSCLAISLEHAVKLLPKE